ncbi:TIGR02206 family membrane protein [Erysipelothrix rhusiopathiae]|uniref:YwaF family protein n=1 Tax=Erysipelothrix rhusiopathiae TaxID=1648 RepID=UPI002FBDA374
MNRLIENLYFSQNPFNIYSPIHILMLVLVGICVGLLIKKREEIAAGGYQSLRWIFLGLYFIQQVLLYSWYGMNQQLTLNDALPLYPCRILQIITIILLITKQERIYEVLGLLGIPAAVTALILADTSGFSFPNAMFIQFFVGHSMMILVPLYMKYRYHFSIQESATVGVIKMVGGYFVVVSFINHLLHTNYGYVSAPPSALSFLNGVPSIIYTCGYFMIYVGVVLIGSKIATHEEEDIILTIES